MVGIFLESNEKFCAVNARENIQIPFFLLLLYLYWYLMLMISALCKRTLFVVPFSFPFASSYIGC